MKLLRYGLAGAEKPGILDDGGALRDLSGIVEDITGTLKAANGLASRRRAMA